MRLAVSFVLFQVFFSQLSLASDLQRERRLKDQIVDAIMDGEVTMLSVDRHEFLALHTVADEPKGSVVIMHGRGFHPDWADAINPLRVGLVEHGWSTLSIQMPVLEKTAKFYDYVPIFDEAVPRIDAAIDYLKAQGKGQIVLLAHSCGAHMALEYIRQQGEQRFDAYVGIGMGATDYNQPMLKPFPLNSMKKPVLDVYGGKDYPAVQRLAGIRAQQMQDEGNPLSRQIVVPGANHYFTDMGQPLVEVVAEWLEKLN